MSKKYLDSSVHGCSEQRGEHAIIARPHLVRFPEPSKTVPAIGTKSFPHELVGKSSYSCHSRWLKQFSLIFLKDLEAGSPNQGIGMFGISGDVSLVVQMVSFSLYPLCLYIPGFVHPSFFFRSSLRLDQQHPKYFSVN